MALLARRQRQQGAGALRGVEALRPTGGWQNVGRHLLIAVVQHPARGVRKLPAAEARHQRKALRRMQLELHLVAVLRQIVGEEDDLWIAHLRPIQPLKRLRIARQDSV